MKLPYEQWKKLDEAMALLDETVNAVPMGIQIEPEAPSLVQLSAEMWELIDELKPDEETKWLWQWKNTWKWWIELGKARMPNLVK